MNQEIKVIIGIGLVTFVLFFGGIYFLQNTSGPAQPTASVDSAKLIRDDSYKIATSSAKVTVVEFADMQCPACKAAHPTVKSMLTKHNGKVNYVFRHFPLTMHRHAQKAAEVAEAAGEQGKFWEMIDTLFTFQSDWSEVGDPMEKFKQYAQEIGLNMDEFTKAVESGKHTGKVQRDLEDGIGLGVNSTPTFFVNEQMLGGKSLEAVVEEALR